MNRVETLSKFLSTPWSPRFSLRGLMWAVVFVAANCSLMAAIDPRISAGALYVAFSVNLVLIGAFLVTQAGMYSIRTITLVTTVCAVAAIGCAFYMRGSIVVRTLVNYDKFATDVETFAVTPIGATVTVVGVVLLATIAAASLTLLFSSRLKVGLLALIWTSVWLMLFDIARETRPFVDPTPHIPATRLIFVE
jgi:hypothetical protein